MVNQYPGKLLFFGEYTIIHGSLALALPYPHLSGSWKIKKKIEKLSAFNASRQSLYELLSYLETNSFEKILDLIRFRRELEGELWFESNIPNGYGCGSSGAVCAGIYDRYALNKTDDPLLLQKELATIEGFFHGQSSGLDPLVCYLKQPIFIGHDGPEVILDYKKEQSSFHFFLIDTNMPRKTTPLVQHYMQKSESASFYKNCIEALKELNALAIGQFLNGEDSLYESWKTISDLEFQHLRCMIPEAFQQIWENGLSTTANYCLKLCGAGGGGYILGISKDWGSSLEELSDFDLIDGVVYR